MATGVAIHEHVGWILLLSLAGAGEAGKNARSHCKFGLMKQLGFSDG